MADLLGPGDAGAVRAASTTSDVSDPQAGDTWFVDCTGASNTGTPVVSKWLNRTLQQMRKVIRAGGVSVDNTNSSMLLTAVQALIQADSPNWIGTFGGTANALTCTLSPAPVSLTANMMVAGLTGSGANTGAVTLTVNGIAQNLLNNAGGALKGGDLPAGTLIVARHDGSYFRLVGLVASQIVVIASSGAVLLSTPGTGSWTAPAGVTRIRLRVWGGAGGGGGSYGAGAGAGGNSGAHAEGFYSVTPGASYSYAVGAGGTAGAAGGDGGSGGTTSFGGMISAGGGGGGGNGSNTSGATGAGAYASGGTVLNYQGNTGGYGFIIPSVSAKGGVGGAGFGGSTTDSPPCTSTGSPVSGYTGNLGCAGSGGASLAGSGAAGGAGQPGFIVIEY